jgi:hypothetical protein
MKECVEKFPNFMAWGARYEKENAAWIASNPSKDTPM